MLRRRQNNSRNHNDMQGNSGTLVLGDSILAGSWMVKSSLETTNERLAAVEAGLAEAREAIAAGGADKPAPARRGPDPDKHYDVPTDGAPTRGPLTAKVEIVEFSDFQ